MEFDSTFYMLAIPAAFIAGFAKGGFGGSAAFVATAILALLVEPAVALGIMLPLLILVDLVTLRPFWRQWEPRCAKALILGGVPGVVLGAVLYQYTNADVLRVLIGVIAIGFVIYQMARARGLLNVKQAEFRWRYGLGAGLVSGFTSFVSHAGGPPTAMFLLSQGVGKTQMQSTAVISFTFINAIKAIPYGFLGVFTFETLKADVIMAPAALIGCAAGIYAHHKMPDRVFFAIIYVMLIGAGSKLVFDGIT